MRIASILLLALVATIPAVEPPVAKQPVPAPAPTDPIFKKLPDENDAAALALMDLRTVPEADQPFMWYVWIEGGSPQMAQAMSAVPNIDSQATKIYRPTPVIAGKLVLLRMDLRLYAPRVAELKEWLALREEFRNDPKFSLFITKDTIKQLVIQEGESAPTFSRRVTKTRRVKGRNGKTRSVTAESLEDVSVKDIKDLELVRLVGRNLNPEVWRELTARTNSQAPIVSHRYFLFRMLSTIQEKGLWKEVYGGLYYEFAGIRENKTGKGTDEDLWFQDHIGLGDVQAGLTAKKIYDRILSDSKVAMWKSRITGKVRAIDYGHGPNEKDGTGNWAVTHDPFDEDIDYGRHAMYNLAKLKDRAREGIWGRPNGMHGYVMFNDAGKLQREVPFQVAANRKIPSPNTVRLQGGIGCMSCHEVEAEGWQPLRNEVQDLLAALAGDTSNAKATIPEVLERLQGQYQGDPTEWLNRGRNDYSRAVLTATGVLDRVNDPLGKNIVKTLGAMLTKEYMDYYYEPIDARAALLDIGLDAPEDVPGPHQLDFVQPSIKVLRAVFPLDGGQDLGLGIPIDVTLLALQKGQSVGRTDWDKFRGFAAPRLQMALAAAQKKQTRRNSHDKVPVVRLRRAG